MQLTAEARSTQRTAEHEFEHRHAGGELGDNQRFWMVPRASFVIQKLLFSAFSASLRLTGFRF